ncbi:MAG: pilus (MSHA type) biogenesis protein MshL [Deltaproteobacteria bacterium]|nr:pilus (MSHA type) biogenesis protein MshL [Deltaproteobacteria bacterium]
MAKHRLTITALRCVARLAVLTAVVSVTACSARPDAIRSDKPLINEGMTRAPGWKPDSPPLPREVTPPDFVPVTEEIVPLKTKMVNIVVRNSSLGDVLHVLADASGLNLLIDRDVPLDQPVTLSLRNASAEDALKTVFSTVDCFYTIQGNVLKVESVGTRVFELGHPALVNSYNMDVGGDILGGAMTAGGGSSNVKGTITSGSKADTKAHDFWESLEKSLEGLMGKKDAQGGRTGRTADSGARPQEKQPSRGTPSQSAREGAASDLTVIDRAGGASASGESQPQQSIIVNRLTGTIVVTATRKGMEKVERYIENVRKVLNRQVMIEARIIEVQLNEGLNFGIDWSFLNNVKALGGPVNTGFGALNIATRDFNTATEAAANTSRFQVGIRRADFQALLTALKTQGDVKTLSNPKINVMNGHASILTVGRNTSFISRITSSTTAAAGSTPVTTFSVETSSILSGMIIGIVPYVSETGDISINITPITSDLVTLQEKTVGSAGNQTVISVPTVDLREMTTTVKMRDGQMVIIGGLISKKETSNEEKIPFIGDIPYLGRLFTRTNNAESRSELVLLLRPHIVSNE